MNISRYIFNYTITGCMLLWCNIGYCSEVRSVFHYNSQIYSRSETSNSQEFGAIHVPLPRHLDLLPTHTPRSSIYLKSTIEFSQASSYFHSTAADNNEKYIFVATPTKAESLGHCYLVMLAGDGDHVDCKWNNKLSLPLTLIDIQNGHEINRQNVTINASIGDSSNDTDQYTSIIGEIELDESNGTLSGLAVDTTALDNLHLEWTITEVDDTSGSPNSWTGSLTLNGTSGTTIHRSLTPEALNASFSAQSIDQNKTVTLSGPKENEPLSAIYIYHDNTPCDDSSLCAYSLNNAAATIVCDDNNVHLAFNKTCSASATSLCQDGKVGDIQGTWGRVAIDTMCAISVTIPYE